MVPQFGGIGIEASTNWRIATTVRAGGCQLSAISLQLLHFLHRRRQHLLHLYYLRCEALVVWIVQIFQIMSEQKIGIHVHLATPSQSVETEPSPHHPSYSSPQRYSSRSMLTHAASGLSDRTFHLVEKSCSMRKHRESSDAPSPTLEDSENSACPLRS